MGAFKHRGLDARAECQAGGEPGREDPLEDDAGVGIGQGCSRVEHGLVVVDGECKVEDVAWVEAEVAWTPAKFAGSMPLRRSAMLREAMRTPVPGKMKSVKVAVVVKKMDFLEEIWTS